MNFTVLLIASTFLTLDWALPLVLSRRKISFFCNTWKEEYFTPCYVAKCDASCDNPGGLCPDNFHPVVKDCRPGCVCAPGFVRDNEGICTIARVACKFQDLADSFSGDPFWNDPLTSVRRKNRRRGSRYTT